MCTNVYTPTMRAVIAWVPGATCPAIARDTVPRRISSPCQRDRQPTPRGRSTPGKRSRRSSASRRFATGRRRWSRGFCPAGPCWPSFRPAAERASATNCRRCVLDGLTLVISPLIALMKDQLDFLVVARRAGRAARFEPLARGNARRSRRDERRPAEAAVRLARAAGQRAVSAVARAAEDRAVGRGRGALHQRVGAQFPARLSQDRRTRPATRRRARAGPHGDGHAPGRRRHRPELRHRPGRRGQHGLLPAEPDAVRFAVRGGRAGRAALGASRRASAGPDDRLRHPATHGRGGRRAARPARLRRPGVSRRHGDRGPHRHPGRLHGLRPA